MWRADISDRDGAEKNVGKLIVLTVVCIEFARVVVCYHSVATRMFVRSK